MKGFRKSHVLIPHVGFLESTQETENCFFALVLFPKQLFVCFRNSDTYEPIDACAAVSQILVTVSTFALLTDTAAVLTLNAQQNFNLCWI